MALFLAILFKVCRCSDKNIIDKDNSIIEYDNKLDGENK